MVTGQEIQYTYSESPRREINWCSISIDEAIASGKRLKASVYNPKARRARETVSNCKWGSVPLCGERGLAAAYMGGRFKRTLVEKSDLPLYLPSSAIDIYPTPDAYLSKNNKYNLDSLRVRKGQVILTRSGIIGKTFFVSDALDGKILSDDLIRLDAKTPGDAGYIYAFLRSAIGNTLVQTNNYGAVIQHIEPEHLRGIPIPDPPTELKAGIGGLIVRSYELRDKSNDLLDMATAMLAAELGLPPLDEIPTDKIGPASSANASSVKFLELSGRLDGSYHAPIVRAIAGHLRSHAAEVTSVGDARVSKEIILPGRFKRIYVEEGNGRVFLSGKSIMELDPYDKKYISFSQHGKRIREQLTIRHNMILVTCSGTVGKVALVPKHWDNWVMTHDIIRIVPAENIAGYVFAWLKTDYARTLIEATAYGAVIPHIEISHISGIPVPLLRNPGMQAEINRLALEANELRFQAHKLEKEAIGVFEKEALGL